MHWYKVKYNSNWVYCYILIIFKFSFCSALNKIKTFSWALSPNKPNGEIDPGTYFQKKVERSMEMG